MARWTAAAAAALLGVVAAGQPAEAAGFSQRTLKGVWTLFVAGFVSEDTRLPFPGGTPLFAVATVTFDGRGRCSSIDQLVVGGVRIPAEPDRFRRSSDCSYTVSRDGTGFFRVTFPAQAAPGGEIPASTTTASFVIQNRGRLHFIADNAGLGIHGGGEMQRQAGAR